MNPLKRSKDDRSALDWLQALWRFFRPHTIIGTSLSVIGLAVMALALLPATESGGGVTAAIAHLPVPWPQFGLWIVAALVPSLCANVYIVGLNQLEDIAIDRINKPMLPLASGAFSRGEGRAIVAVTGLAALLLSAIQGAFLLGTVASSLLIGTAYSLPPIRLKRFPVWASLCIFGVRGGIVNLGFFAHFQERLSGTVTLPAELWTLTAFVVLFTFAIAIFKDIPDREGDRLFKIRTFTLKLGVRSVFNLARGVLTGCYGLIMAIALLGLLSIQPWVLVITHLGLLGLLWGVSIQVDLQDNRQISQFYQFIWKLFFLEYLLFPIVCLFG